MNRKLNLLILMLVPHSLNGCWDSQELNSLSIVSATSIDRARTNGSSPSKSSFRSPSPPRPAAEPGKPISDHHLLHQGQDHSRSDAEREFRSAACAVFAHNSVLIINEQVVRNEGVRQILDFSSVRWKVGKRCRFS